MHAVAPRALVLVLVASAPAFAGCFGGDEATPAATGPVVPSAAPAEAGADTGAVEGIVTDDELEPIVGAEVGLLQTDFRTLSDTDGRYSLSHVPPGDHQLLAAKLGYEPAARSISIEAGEVTEADLALAPVPVREPYTITQNQRGLFGCGLSWRPPTVFSGIAVCGVFSLLLNATQYDNFLLLWPIDQPTADWKSSVFEMRWTSNQALGHGLTMIWEVDDCPNVAAYRFAREAGRNPLYANVNEGIIQGVIQNGTVAENVEDCEDAPGNCNENECTLMSRVFSAPDTLGNASVADVGVTFQQQFEQYHTAFFFEPAPPDYSAYTGS